jgi:SAM-dependent methyltransferase
MYSLYRETLRFLGAHCRGRVLDVGSGRQGWRQTIERIADDYHSLDRNEPGGRRPTYLADAHGMVSVPDLSYDTVVSTQVLEHVADPSTTLAEMDRVLRPGGKVILTVPHLSRRHELPHDYLRYTQEGVMAFLETAGFEVVEIQAYGGVLSFLHHQTSFVFPGLLTAAPALAEVAILLNAPLSWSLAALDPILDPGRLLPLGVAAAARKSV